MIIVRGVRACCYALFLSVLCVVCDEKLAKIGVRVVKN